MTEEMADAMQTALQQTRSGDPIAATRTLQAALHGRGAEVRPDVGEDDPADCGFAPSARFVRQPTGFRPLGLATLDQSKRFEAFRPTSGAMPKPTLDAARSTFRTRPSPDVPDGATYVHRRFNTPLGARDGRVFVPSPRSEPVAGLVLMLHGCTQTVDDFTIGTGMIAHAERNNVVLVFPEQTRQHNQMGCWNWFRAEDQGRGQGETALLAQIASDVAKEFGIVKGQVFAAGLSAGGAMAANLGAAYPEVFGAVGIHSGLAPGAARDLASAQLAMQGRGCAHPPKPSHMVRAIVFHGAADTTVAPANGAAAIGAFIAERSTVEIEDTSVEGASIHVYQNRDGTCVAEHWVLPGVRHAWSGGAAEGSYTDPNGPDASAEMMRFFLDA